MEGEWMSIEDFLADNQLTQALASLRVFGSTTPNQVRLLKDDDVDKMLQQEEAPMKKLVARKLRLALSEWRIDALDMAIPVPSTKPGREPPRDFKMGIEAADYVNKYYRCQLVGYSTSGLGGVNQFGGNIRQTADVPAGSCRFLVHFEGWAPQWDEYIVLPDQASRFRSLPDGPNSGGTGTSSERTALLGLVYGLKVNTPAGVRAAAAEALVIKDHRCFSPATQWEGLSVMLLLKYEDGTSEWLELSKEDERRRLVDGHRWTYPS